MLNKLTRLSVRCHAIGFLMPLLCALYLSFPTPASADIMADRLAITDVLAQYAYRWDGKDAVGFAELFTDDGVFERQVNGEPVPGSRLIGRQAIFEYARESHQGRLADRQSRHHFSSIVFLELNPEIAITENVALITHQTASEAHPLIQMSGIYRITWRKTAAGWQMSKRILMVDHQ